LVFHILVPILVAKDFKLFIFKKLYEAKLQKYFELTTILTQLLTKLLTIKVFVSRKDFRCCLVYRGQKEKKVLKTA